MQTGDNLHLLVQLENLLATQPREDRCGRYGCVKKRHKSFCQIKYADDENWTEFGRVGEARLRWFGCVPKRELWTKNFSEGFPTKVVDAIKMVGGTKELQHMVWLRLTTCWGSIHKNQKRKRKVKLLCKSQQTQIWCFLFSLSWTSDSIVTKEYNQY